MSSAINASPSPLDLYYIRAWLKQLWQTITVMSKTYKTVIHLSSAAERPRERTGSDPLPHGAAKLRKDSSPSGSKHVSAAF